MINQAFKNALKLHPTPQHKLAWKVGISPSTLSHLLNEHQKVKRGDKRLLEIARLINFPSGKVFIDDGVDQ